MTVNVKWARDVAQIAHMGQKDKQERDYFLFHLHPVAMLCEGHSPEAEMAGWLHDIVEDCGPKYSLDWMRECGVPEVVVDAVDACTRREGESYDDLITRACEHRLGCVVKLADNKINIGNAIGYARSDPTKAQHMLMTRYLPARDRLVVAANYWEYLP